MSRSFVKAVRAPLAALLIVGSAAGASPAFADNDFVVLSGSSVTEGDSGSTPLNFTIRVASPPSAPISMRFTALGNHTTVQPGDATPGSTCGGGVDFVAVDSVVTIPANANPPQITVSVPVCGDTAVEGNESFSAILRNVQGAGAYCAESCAAFGTIIDNDTAPPPSISAANASVLEGDPPVLGAAQRRLNFQVSLSAASTVAVTVDYQTSSNKGSVGTVASGGFWCGFGTDFIQTSGTLQFNPGETRKTVQVTVCGDNLNESNETMVLHLSNPAGATITDGFAVGTIIDDD
jgi:hypothetical protein